eukprot:augustus_masked-scaffold_15-processed-gene-1.38-mRNA-1 protein AED:0.11 eAED:1.00 QI:0/-1/0/1/-1/1/1/0/252
MASLIINSPERKTLEKQLASRPSLTSLENRHFLFPSRHQRVSSVLHVNAKELEKNFTRNKLKSMIEQRPTREELEQKHVLKYGRRMSAVLQSSAEVLEQEIKKDKVNAMLRKRPSKTELRRTSILPNELNLADSLQANAASLKKAFQKDKVHQLLTKDKLSAGATLPVDAKKRLDAEINDIRVPYSQTENTTGLKAISDLFEAGKITQRQRGYLKDLIIKESKAVHEVISGFLQTKDANQLYSGLLRIAAER